MDKEEIIEKGMTKRDALNFLIVDETEAISGYDKVLKACGWDESDRIELERLRNAEIDHISDLSKIFNKHSTAKVVGTDSVDSAAIAAVATYREGSEKVVEALLNNGYKKVREKGSIHFYSKGNLNGTVYGVDERNYKSFLSGNYGSKWVDDIKDERPAVKWRMHQAPSGYFYFKAPNGETYKENGIEVRFASKLPAGEFFVTTLFNRSLWGQEVPRVIKDARAAGNVVKVDGGWAITSDKNWWTAYNPNGFFKFSSTTPEDRTVFKTEEEARKVAAKMLKEVYGIGDSNIADYQARGSFGSIGELKSHYAGASLRPKSDGLTVVLKSGAELEYSYGDGGTLIFIRGRN